MSILAAENCSKEDSRPKHLFFFLTFLLDLQLRTTIIVVSPFNNSLCDWMAFSRDILGLVPFILSSDTHKRTRYNCYKGHYHATKAIINRGTC